MERIGVNDRSFCAWILDSPDDIIFRPADLRHDLLLPNGNVRNLINRYLEEERIVQVSASYDASYDSTSGKQPVPFYEVTELGREFAFAVIVDFFKPKIHREFDHKGTKLH